MLGLPIATFAIASGPVPVAQPPTNATAILSGIAASPAVGTIVALGAAAATAMLIGVAAAPAVGALTVTGATSATAVLVGVAALPAVGMLSASASAALATRASVRVIGIDGSPLPGLSGLRWAFFDAHTLDQLRAPTAQGSGATTDAGGNLTVNISGTSLMPGAFGYLAFSDGNGSLTQTPPANAFLGLVQVQ